MTFADAYRMLTERGHRINRVGYEVPDGFVLFEYAPDTFDQLVFHVTPDGGTETLTIFESWDLTDKGTVVEIDA